MRLMFLFAGFTMVIAMTGCQNTNKAVVEPNMMRIILSDANSFPEEMVGSWRDQQYGWMLDFQHDGTLSKITHTIGRQDVSMGMTSIKPLRQGGKAVFEPGPWLVQYNGSTRELVVEVTIQHFKYEIQGNTVRGSSTDIFMGALPQNGETIWRANWVSFPEYIATTADKSYLNYRLPTDLESEDKGEVIFEKVLTEKTVQ